MAHFWSLGVEEQFYFVWPLVIWLARPRQVPWIAGGLTLLSALVRLLWVLHYNLNLVVPPLSVEMALATVCRMDALFIGALCAWFFHDRERVQKVARWLAYILCGGRLTAGTLVSEQYILDLEREAFLSLLGERKTQERIAHTLKTGRPLRN